MNTANSLFTQEELDAMKPMQGGEPDAVAQEQAGGEQADETEAAEQAAGERKANRRARRCITAGPSCGAGDCHGCDDRGNLLLYCHNPVVLGKRLEGSYLPNKIIPFEIGREDAEKKFRILSAKKYVPKAFFNKNRLRVYDRRLFPYHLRRGSWRERWGDARSVRMWTTGNTQYTETKHYAVEREGQCRFAI